MGKYIDQTGSAHLMSLIKEAIAESGGGSNNIPIGTVLDYAGSTIPSGYLECDGSAVSRATYPLLFAAIGTVWGIGDGSTTFNLPNLNGRVTIGKGSRTVGDTSVGSESQSYTPSGSVGNTTLTTNQIPGHTHPMDHYHSTNIGHGHERGTLSATTPTLAHSSITQPVFKTYYKATTAAKGTGVRTGPWGSDDATAITASRTTNVAVGDHAAASCTMGGRIKDYTGSKNSGGSLKNSAARNSTDSSGGGQAHNHGFTGTAATISHMQPSAVVRKIIRAY